MASEEFVSMAKTAISARLAERTLPVALVGLEEQYKKVLGLMRRTIETGESNSCLILGPRGTGKTMLVRQALQDLETQFRAPNNDEYNDDDADMEVDDERKDFMVIHLNGLVQTDDRMALKEIMRQLSREGESELGESNTSFSDSLPSLLTFLKAGTRAQYPIIFILDEFDLFAQHTKQSLLYNLFDVAQSAEWPIAVIGVTCRMDALELLEKRVKSRFSHRHYYTFPPGDYHDYIDICRNALLLTPADMEIQPDDDEVMLLGPSNQAAQLFMNEFNERVKILFEDGGFSKVVQRIFDLMKDVRAFYRLCFGPVAELSKDSPYLQASQFYESGLQQRVDNKTELLKGTSLLELSLLIAIKHLVERETITFNFEMVYDEYKEFMDMAVVRGTSMSSSSSALGVSSGGSIASSDGVSLRLYKKAVALKAFEHLVEAELLRPADSFGKGPKEYRMMRVMLDASQISDVVLKHRDCPTIVARWASRRAITLVENPPVDPDGGLALPSGLFNPTLLKELNQLQFSAAIAQNNINTASNTNNPLQTSPTTTLPITNADATSNQAAGSAPTFSISDFLVPGLQTKVWDDWQGADVLNDYSAFDTQDFSSDLNGNPFQFGLDSLLGNAPIWDDNAIPADQAYDEFVFDLAPSAFQTPATVNVADLIVGPNSTASSDSAVSPLDLTMPSVEMYQDFALANLYGFTDPTMGSDSGSDSEVDDDASDDSDDETAKGTAAPVAGPKPTAQVQPTAPVVQHQQSMAPAAPIKREDPNKRRMEEALVARINNDLGPEHMAGLFKILNGASDQDVEEDEDEEMEVDLSCLDETTLVQVYQYVEACCMQTMGSILAAEERERAAMAAAKAAAAAAAAAEAEAMERQRQRYYAERTPELSPGHSSASSSSPSPPHPSSGLSTKGRRANCTKKRSGVQSNSIAMYQAADDIEQDALWTAGHASKARRKRASHGSSTGVGGGNTDKGRRIQKDMIQIQQLQQENVVILRATDDDDEMEFGEDAEIDVVG
ncbi:origin recognition complex subunit 4 [Mortierella sp. 14UC]|nr:origin recognition complex subunit 4 [Mortierella sp. 14UC]